MKGDPCLCTHARTRHRQRYGEPYTGKCRDCICEVFEVEPVEAPKSAPQPPAPRLPPARGEAALSPEDAVGLQPTAYRPPLQRPGEPLPFGLPLTRVVR